MAVLHYTVYGGGGVVVNSPASVYCEVRVEAATYFGYLTRYIAKCLMPERTATTSQHFDIEFLFVGK